MVLMSASGGYIGPPFNWDQGMVIIKSLRSEGDGDPQINYQLDELDDLRIVLKHIMGVLVETNNYLISVHQFERVICVTIDGRSAEWEELERLADPRNAQEQRRRVGRRS